MLPVETVKKLVPKSYRSHISQRFLDQIESYATDEVMASNFKENFITYLNVLSKGKYKMDDYINAIKYVSLKLLGYSNVKAYATVFPDRYQRLKDNGANIDSYVSMYNGNKLVIQIYEQTIVPTYVLNAPMHQQALTELARMVQDEEVKGYNKIKALETILAYTKQPEVVKGELSINIEQSDAISDLREVTENLANMHKVMLEKGITDLKTINEGKIIDINGSELDE